MIVERYCLRLEQCSPYERFDSHPPVPCAECGSLVVHNERTTEGIRFVCMECLIGETT